MSFLIKLYFFSNINYILNLLKYSNIINIYLDKIIYYNILIKNGFIKGLLKNKDKMVIILNLLNIKIINLLLFYILNFFLILKKNLFKILKKNKLIIIKSNIKKCDIIL